jgi:threonine dehydrogenase-like Zn-dependent dehydrogenase
MWAHRLIAPGQLEAVEADEPGEPRPGRVVARFEAGGICGSDLPSFLGYRDLLVGASHGKPGYPMHELVGVVEASAADDLPVGARVVGWAEGHLGLAEKFAARADQVCALDDELPSIQATVIQPLCTVLYAVRRLGDVRGARIAVIGQGSIGMLFSYVLKAAGAGHVTGVDPIDRRDAADAFGVDTMEWSTSSEWAASLGDDARPDIVVEAVGHQAATLEDAVEAVAHGGTVLAFGVPDETHYAFPFARFFRKDATLLAGITQDRRRSLATARDYLVEHRGMLDAYITDVFPVAEAQAAFELAVKPTAGRLKVALEG